MNSAKYLKVGQSVWVDRLFSQGVVNGIYTFHASAAAYTDYWNNSIWKHQSVHCKKITQHQVWHAFVQESIRTIASASGSDLVLQDGLAIDEVTREAFSHLGENGVIGIATGHSCSECTQKYKKTVDIIHSADPAATIGGGDIIDLLPIQPTSGQSQLGRTAETEELNIGEPLVTMAVLDGIVMGPTVCLNNFILKV